MTFLLNHLIRENKIGNYATWKMILDTSELLDILHKQKVMVLSTTSKTGKKKYIFLGTLENIIAAYNACIDAVKITRPKAPFKKYA